MSDVQGTYSFLPWLRTGAGATIATADGDAAVHDRASIHVELQLAGTAVGGGAALSDSVARDVGLYGPGDVIGIDRRAIVRTEPHDWITNFEPNYLAQIEFYDEDFPWRYTPAAPDATRLQLRPWITLLVLTEAEFRDGTDPAERPLPYIDVLAPAALPEPAQLWAWGHVHVNRSLAGSDTEFYTTDMSAVIGRFLAVLGENPDLAYSRIVCPRRLAPNTAYHAFLVPTFETGRLAGLGEDPAGAAHATVSAWTTGQPPPVSLPVYHRWYFRTATEGDFEYLVRLLEPRTVDSRVGTRDMDVLHPGSNLPPIDDAQLAGVLKLGGALRVPEEALTPAEIEIVRRYDHWADPYPHRFQVALARLVNLADDYAAQPALPSNAASGLGPNVETDPDPLVTAPLYGRWHALTQRLLLDRGGSRVTPDDNWVHELNLDPRHRVAAGFGTGVVQANQEDLMLAAWEQIGDVLEANRRIREAQLAREAGARLYARHLAPLATAEPARVLALTAPAQRHVLADGATVPYLRAASLAPPVLTSAPMRRAVRPGSRLIRSLPFDAARPPERLIERVNAGEVTAAPPKQAPPAVTTTDDIATTLLPPDLPPAVVDALRRFGWLIYIPLVLAVLLVIVAILIGGPWALLLVALAVAFVALWWYLRLRLDAIRRADTQSESGLTPEAVDALPGSPDFTIAEPGSGARPTLGGADSPEAVRFKRALRDWHSLAVAGTAAGARPVPATLALGAVSTTLVAALDPDVTVPRRLLASVEIPGRIAAELDETFQEVMAYPVIDQPMYKPLADISSELFLPNLNLIEQNSITLLETNRTFIEAYLVGLNHEFARELLWREYPTDQRGSYFRQFWDPRGFLTAPGADSEQLKETLRDIPKLHLWPRRSHLGAHDNRSAHGPGESVVLVIRGELLKKYPTAVIYAHLARWGRHDNGTIDPTKERDLEPLVGAEADNPPRTKLKTPLFEAKIDPDIYFFGFDLTAADAEGGTGEHPDDPPGWFFVIKERPGEPRFGFDIERDGNIVTFNDLAWNDAMPGGAEGDFLQATALSPLGLDPPGSEEGEKTAQHADDVRVAPAPPSAARWATLLYQAPVMVAVHAAEMLRERT